MVHMMHILSILSSVGLCRCHMLMYVKYQDVYRVTPHVDNDCSCSVEKPACCGVCQY